MPRASRLLEMLAYAAPVLFGCRQWLRAERHDPQYFELDPVG